MTEPTASETADRAAEELTYHPESCCMCRWIVWNEDCGHPIANTLVSPHDHCELHGRPDPDALDAEELDPAAEWNIAGVDR